MARLLGNVMLLRDLIILNIPNFMVISIGNLEEKENLTIYSIEKLSIKPSGIFNQKQKR